MPKLVFIRIQAEKQQSLNIGPIQYNIFLKKNFSFGEEYSFSHHLRGPPVKRSFLLNSLTI